MKWISYVLFGCFLSGCQNPISPADGLLQSDPVYKGQSSTSVTEPQQQNFTYSGRYWVYNPASHDVNEVPDWSAYDDPNIAYQSIVPNGVERWTFASDPENATISGLGIKTSLKTYVEIANITEQQAKGIIFSLDGYRPCSEKEADTTSEVIDGHKWVHVHCKLSK
jgi:hypothetical protein